MKAERRTVVRGRDRVAARTKTMVAIAFCLICYKAICEDRKSR